MTTDSRLAAKSAVVDFPVASAAQPASNKPQAVSGVTHRTFTVRTNTRLELINLTDRVRDAVRESSVRDGLVLVSSLHTTMGLMVNEWQEALVQDIKEMLGQVIPADREYRHNDPRYSDCDRKNAHAHLQATLLKHSLTFGVASGKLSLGQFQAIIAAELDGPRERQIAVQIFPSA
jgi:secondary thiamine-phosphate synthase enzyme